MWRAAANGHTEIVQTLVAVPGIDVNLATKVSLYPTHPFLGVVEDRCKEGVPPLPSLSTLRNDDITHLLGSKRPHHHEKKYKFIFHLFLVKVVSPLLSHILSHLIIVLLNLSSNS